MVRFYLRFKGRVQGVGFRFFAAMNAERCHLTGWVKNMSDGSVTAEVQGTRVEIEKFLNLIHQTYFLPILSNDIFLHSSLQKNEKIGRAHV